MVIVPITSSNKNKETFICPKYETKYSSGVDVCAFISDNIIIEPGKHAMIPTNLTVAIPEGYEIQVRSRSGLAAKNGVFVLNSPGTIDSDYRGEIKVILANFGDEPFTVSPNMRIAQLVLNKVEQMYFRYFNELDDTDRGSGGFGSTGI